MPGIISAISTAVPRRTWVALALLCVVAALVLWNMGRGDAAFVAAAVGVVAWFLNLRVQFAGVSAEAGAARADDEEEASEEDESDESQGRGEDEGVNKVEGDDGTRDESV